MRTGEARGGLRQEKTLGQLRKMLDGRLGCAQPGDTWVKNRWPLMRLAPAMAQCPLSTTCQSPSTVTKRLQNQNQPWGSQGPSPHTWLIQAYRLPACRSWVPVKLFTHTFKFSETTKFQGQSPEVLSRPPHPTAGSLRRPQLAGGDPVPPAITHLTPQQLMGSPCMDFQASVRMRMGHSTGTGPTMMSRHSPSAMFALSRPTAGSGTMSWWSCQRQENVRRCSGVVHSFSGPCLPLGQSSQLPPRAHLRGQLHGQ